MRRRRTRTRTKTYLITVLLLVSVALGAFVGNALGNANALKLQQEEQKKAAAIQKELDDLKEAIKQEEEKQEEPLPWYLVLVNPTTYMEEGYVPELASVSGSYKVDARIVDAAKLMLSDAKKAGLNVIVCSAYRSVEQQKQVFSDSMRRRVNSGMRYWEAYVETTKNVAVPGTSEHSLGLALDLISQSYQELDEKQANTAEAKWLAQNCYKYGFILRYPSDKSDITGIVFEPWHFRYVGVEHATKIMESGLTLEEYLEQYQKGEIEI